VGLAEEGPGHEGSVEGTDGMYRDPCGFCLSVCLPASRARDCCLRCKKRGEWKKFSAASHAKPPRRQIPIRIAGIDAPEGAHFGRPAQPYSAEALAWLQSYLLHRRVHCKIWRRDQYDRVVASVCVRRGPGPRLNLLRRDVGLEMLRRGLATTYEAKTGAEFGGRDMERRYRAAEERARLRGVGLWAGEKASWFGLKPGKGAPETPRQYKTRMREAENGQGEDSAKEVGEKVKNAVKAVAKDVQKGA
jgi:endonuclease YncB( thermonuclease family)